MLNKIRLVASSYLLALLMTGCLKSDEPVRFQGGLVDSVSSTVLGKAVGGINSETGRLARVVQLRTEGSNTYLYTCTPGAEIKKIQAVLYVIPGHENTFVVSLEEGKFFFDGNEFGHEFFVLQPHSEIMAWWQIDDNTSDVAKNYFSEVRATSENMNTYPVATVKEFLVNYVDEFIQEEGISGYKYLQGDLTSCDFMN